MMVWAVQEASERGFTIEREAFDKIRNVSVDNPEAGKLLPGIASDKPPSEQFALSPAYVALASKAIPDTQVTDLQRSARTKLREYLVKTQMADGSWKHGGGRPPIFENAEIITLMCLLALDGDTDEVRAAQAKARDWLSAREPVSDQARLLRILDLCRTGADDKIISAEAATIVSKQNPDGGWSQTKDMPSDAYATGMTIYTLVEAGTKPDDPAIARAVEFLLKTQTEDGNWPMTSRPSGPEDKGAKDLRPITFAGSAWATLGLLRALPN